MPKISELKNDITKISSISNSAKRYGGICYGGIILINFFNLNALAMCGDKNMIQYESAPIFPFILKKVQSEPHRLSYNQALRWNIYACQT